MKRTWSKIETIRLIESYEARPDLWNPSRPKYHDRNLKQTLLAEIANELNVPTAEITSKFHALRTQFNREINKERNTKSGSSTEENYVSRWDFKSSLQFLQVNAIESRTVSNLVGSLSVNIHFFSHILWCIMCMLSNSFRIYTIHHHPIRLHHYQHHQNRSLSQIRPIRRRILRLNHLHLRIIINAPDCHILHNINQKNGL